MIDTFKTIGMLRGDYDKLSLYTLRTEKRLSLCGEKVIKLYDVIEDKDSAYANLSQANSLNKADKVKLDKYSKRLERKVIWLKWRGWIFTGGGVVAGYEIGKNISAIRGLF